MNELLTTLKDILAGSKIRWPAKKDQLDEAPAHQGETPDERERSSSSSTSRRPKRPAPRRPPTSSSGTSQSRPQNKDEQGLVISNLASNSQESPVTAVAMVTSLSQDAGTSACEDTEKKKERDSKRTHKQALKRNLSSSTEPLLAESSPSLSAEDDIMVDIFPVPVVPPPPLEGDGEVTMATNQKKRKHRKSGEFKSEGESKQKSKAKRKRKLEFDTLERKMSKSEERSSQQQRGGVGLFTMSEPAEEERELPLPQEIAEAAAINEAIITGVPARNGEEKDDFILEPPPRFSQSSVDYFDEFGDIDDSGPLSFDLAPPTAPSDDEMEVEKPHPPIGHKKQTEIHEPPRQQTSDKKKPVSVRSFEDKNSALAAIDSEEKEAGSDQEEFEDEWQGLDYPVKKPPSQRVSGTTSARSSHGRETADGRQTRSVFPLGDQENEFDEFSHRAALEEPPDSEDGDGEGVLLDEDLAALLW